MRLLLCSLLLLGSSCATHPIEKMETCTTWPEAAGMACTDPHGKQYIKPYTEALDYVCFPVEQFSDYAKGCLKR